MNTTPEQVTARIWQEVASLITTGIKFTTDIPSNHPSGYVPILDFQEKIVSEIVGKDANNQYIIKDKVEVIFYKKEVSNWLVVQEMVALPSRTKYSTLAAEALRRLHNTSSSVPSEVTRGKRMRRKLREEADWFQKTPVNTTTKRPG